MGKLACGLMIGFMAGMHCHNMGKKMCMKRMMRKTLRRVGL